MTFQITRKLSVCRGLVGTLFHGRGPATAKLLSPNLLEGRHMTYRSSKSAHRCDLCASQSDQKYDKGRNLVRQTGHSIRPPTSPDRNTDGVVGSRPAVVISFEFHQHQVSSYRAVSCRNLADLIT